jgi:hypothetical protein
MTLPQKQQNVNRDISKGAHIKYWANSFQNKYWASKLQLTPFNLGLCANNPLRFELCYDPYELHNLCKKQTSSRKWLYIPWNCHITTTTTK